MGRTNRSLIISLLLLAVSLMTVTVVLADYLGPDRTTTTIVWRRLRCSYQAVNDPSGPGWDGCSLTLYFPPSSGCPSTSSVSGYFTPAACGWGPCSSPDCSISLSSSTEGCSEGESGCEGSTQTVNQPPAIISGNISCAAPGSNGWCQSAASLSLSGSEPLSGYAITALEGTRNGTTFACSGASCSVDLLEGQNDFTYWALSSWGDSSTMGSASGKVDTQPPVINGTLNGITGDNGWYVSDVTVSASASDGMSGLQSFDINVDGGGYQPYAEVTLGEGAHTIDLRAVDNAGHVSSASQSFSVDTTAPVLALSGGGSFCPRCGDVLALSYDVQDALSGISGWTLSASGAVIASNTIAGSAIVDWDGSGLGGGTHTLTLSARDAAGNTAESSIIITLNTPRPEPTQARIILPTRTPTPRPVVPALAPPEPGLAQSKPSLFTFISEPPETRGFSSPPENPPASEQPVSAQATASPVLWGGAAAGLIGAAMVVAMEAQRKRKEEEARQIAEMHRLNAEMRAREKQEALLIAQNREAAEYEALMAAMAAEGAVQAKLEDEEQAWLEKKAAADKAAAGKGVATASQTVSAATLQAGLMAYYEGRKEGEAEAETSQEKNQEESKSWLAYIPVIGDSLDNAWQSVKQKWGDYVAEPLHNLSTGIKEFSTPIKTSLALLGTGLTIVSAIGLYGLQQGNIPTRDHQDPWWCAWASSFGINPRSCVDNFLAYEQGEWQTWPLPPPRIVVLAAPTPTPQPCKDEYCVGQTFYTGGGVNIRDSAGGSVLSLLECGDNITLVGGFETRVLDGVEYLWAQVDTSSGLKGVWVAISLFNDSDHQEKTCETGGNRTMQEGLIATQGGGFDNNDIYGINAAGNNIANAFADALGAGYSPEDAWNTVFGNITVTFVETGYSCSGVGDYYFEETWDDGCWAATGSGGQVFVTNEFINTSPSSGEIAEWASHETGHVVDRLMTQKYGWASGNFYGANQIAQFPGGLEAVNEAIPGYIRQSSQYNVPLEVFADAFSCWSHPICEFSDPKFAEYFDNLMMQFAIDCSN